MRPKIGAHVSTSGGLYHCFENAEKIEAETIQIFGANPRQWHAKIPSPADIEKYKQAHKECGVEPVFLHSAYLVNLGSPSHTARARTIKNLTDHLRIAEMINAQGLIFHIGSGKELPRNIAMDYVVSGIKKILADVSGKIQLVMENASGGGGKLGTTADDMKILLDKVASQRLKVCFDTAHAFEAGIIKEYTPYNIAKLFDEWDKKIGLQNIVAIHANDSKTRYDSHHDRHENIGNGFIGLSGFKNLARETRLHNKAWILEVPGLKDKKTARENIRLLKSCFQ